MSIHIHVTAWVLTLVLFFIAFGLQKAGKEKGQKIVHMILRLFYLITFATGGMFVHYLISSYLVETILKVLSGILVIGFMEMVLVRTKKGKTTTVFWVLFLLSLISVLYLGYSLPM
ncbi:YisL family protein [Robertmurraya sp. DFI.2.37]|jgi:hypothetical protein|uniref:YisL family protein n=1 Tax=unclassified Robertmurraya TaxID=2837524 RepID=UPI00124625DE|nr:YisL family protein [Robertmurraya sp. DFI.2.37]MDF1507387.1 YisL family protein [Robertmurraya sp. DFI.2.37]